MLTFWCVTLIQILFKVLKMSAVIICAPRVQYLRKPQHSSRTNQKLAPSAVIGANTAHVDT